MDPRYYARLAALALRKKRAETAEYRALQKLIRPGTNTLCWALVVIGALLALAGVSMPFLGTLGVIAFFLGLGIVVLGGLIVDGAVEEKRAELARAPPASSTPREA